ncbi:MAG: MotA/TolQ/ExbB proton channel family protein [Pseudomonadota bacterium]
MSLSLYGYDLQPAVDLVVKGGPVAIILVALSVVATTVMLVKVSRFLWLRLGARSRVERALALWFGARESDAIALLNGARQPAAQVLAGAMRGTHAGHDDRLVRKDVERLAIGKIAQLRSHLRILDVTVQAAPLLGLFGTVIGMISAFQALQTAGADADPAVLAGGIWVALTTTALGLAVALPIAFVNAWLDGRVEAEQRVMEDAVTSLLTGRVSARAPLRTPREEDGNATG